LAFKTAQSCPKVIPGLLVFTNDGAPRAGLHLTLRDDERTTGAITEA